MDTVVAQVGSEGREFRSRHCQAATDGPLSKVLNPQLLGCIN